jgi:hypothetical protein
MGWREDFEKSLLDAAFGTTSSEPQPEEPFSLDALKDVMRALGPPPPPPPKIHITKASTALPGKEPRTLDMKEMVERLGRRRVPAVFHLKTMFGEFYTVHPDLLEHPNRVAETGEL